jgi:hypothetical protein
MTDATLAAPQRAAALVALFVAACRKDGGNPPESRRSLRLAAERLLL